MPELVLRNEELMFAELSTDELMELNGGVDWGMVAEGALTAVTGIATTLTGSPAVGLTECFAGGFMMGRGLARSGCG